MYGIRSWNGGFYFITRIYKYESCRAHEMKTQTRVNVLGN
jgi:hypothetical protein